MNNSSLIHILERLELYLSAGLGLDKALKAATQGCSARHRRMLDLVQRDISAGIQISVAMSTHLRVPSTVTAMIDQGYSSGHLAEALSSARSMLERKAETFKKCISALIYPLVIGAFSILLTIGLIRGVMPQITPMLRSLNVDLPILTKIIIAVSDGIVSYGLYMLILGIVLAIIIVIMYKYVMWFRYGVQVCTLSVPIIGKLMYLYALTIFLRSIGSLIESGADVPTSYTRTVEAISLLPVKRHLKMNIPEIKKGVPLSTIFASALRRIPSHVAPLISAGEASGTLGSSIIRAASIIDRDMDHGLKRLVSLIEPTMMVGMGCSVGGIALSIMMPIYDISKVLQH